MSWVSCDVFDWLGAGPAEYGTMDDEGVPITYPDEPHQIEPSGVNLTPTPETNRIEPVLPGTPLPPDVLPSEPMGSLQLPAEGDRVTHVAFSDEPTGSQSEIGRPLMTESEVVMESAQQKLREKNVRRKKPWFRWARGTDR